MSCRKDPTPPAAGPSPACPTSGTTASCPNSGACKDCPPYEPGRWNDPPIKNSNNCYSYGANDPDGHPPGKPQPGEKCGNPATDATCAEITRAATCDGMVKAPDPPTPKNGYYPVALVMDEHVDYHWYRQDENGNWSHKPGNTEVTDVDASNGKITNPKMANRDYSATGGPNYSEFCGYFYVPKGGVRTGP